MPYPQAIKELAYKLDPECWKSYSGLHPAYKRRLDGRRTASLGTATHQMMESILSSPKPKEHLMAQEPFFSVLIIDDVAPRRQPKPSRMPSLKVTMLLHFYGVCEAFAPEKTRTSPAYTQFVKELLRDGLIERPTKEQREDFPGWAYRTTSKGSALVNAICTTPMPVERTRWVIPERPAS